MIKARLIGSHSLVPAQFIVAAVIIWIEIYCFLFAARAQLRAKWREDQDQGDSENESFPHSQHFPQLYCQTIGTHLFAGLGKVIHKPL